MHRIITRLRSAKLSDTPPNQEWEKAKRKARGSRRQGHSYERIVGKWLRERGLVSHSGQWIEFTDEVGRGHAQPDHFLLLPKAVLLYECKLTQTAGAFLQMAQLYVPLLEHIFERPVMTLQICKHLRYDPEAERTPQDLILRPEFGNFTWHFIGV